MHGVEHDKTSQPKCEALDDHTQSEESESDSLAFSFSFSFFFFFFFFFSFFSCNRSIHWHKGCYRTINKHIWFIHFKSLFFLSLITNFESVVPGSLRTPLWYKQNKQKIISNAKEQAPSLVNPCPRISDLYLVREYGSHASLPVSVKFMFHRNSGLSVLNRVFSHKLFFTNFNMTFEDCTLHQTLIPKCNSAKPRWLLSIYCSRMIPSYPVSIRRT